MKIFARFNTKEDHERLVESMMKERLIRETIQQLKYFKSKGLNNLDQIEKFIETQKLKHKNAGNHYDKNYSGASNYGKAAGSRQI